METLKVIRIFSWPNTGWSSTSAEEAISSVQKAGTDQAVKQMQSELDLLKKKSGTH